MKNKNTTQFEQF